MSPSFLIVVLDHILLGLVRIIQCEMIMIMMAIMMTVMIKRMVMTTINVHLIHSEYLHQVFRKCCKSKTKKKWWLQVRIGSAWLLNIIFLNYRSGSISTINVERKIKNNLMQEKKERKTEREKPDLKYSWEIVNEISLIYRICMEYTLAKNWNPAMPGSWAIYLWLVRQRLSLYYFWELVKKTSEV